MKKSLLFASIFILLFGCVPRPAQALRGTPDTPHFGYGLRLDVNGLRVDDALYWAARHNLDWVALDFDWNATWPEPTRWSNDTSFARAARLASALDLAIVISIHNPPAWAMTANGPHPDLTATLLCDLKRMFPNLHAAELYLRANTIRGWGAVPDPQAYAGVLQAVESRLEKREFSVYLLAGGLSNRLDSPDDVPDTVFLQGLYEAGVYPQIISLRLDHLSGMPADEPSESTSLRHFEHVRSVMLAHGQAGALLWVSGFNLPVELQESSPQEQSEWLLSAYQLMRSRLYFGASFFDCYNPSKTVVRQVCLLEADGDKHPFLLELQGLTGGSKP